MAEFDFSPRVAPGWLNLPDQGMSIVSAAFSGAQVSKQRQQLENQLMKMDLQMKQQEINNAFKEQNYHLAVSRLLMQNDTAQRNSALREQGLVNQWQLGNAKLALAGEVEDLRAEKYHSAIQGISTLGTSLAALDVDPTDPDFHRKVSALMADPTIAAGANTPLGRQLVASKYVDFNKATNNAQKALDAEGKSIAFDVSRDIWGDPRNQDMSPLFDTSKWEIQTRYKSGAMKGELGPTLTMHDFDPKTGKLIDPLKMKDLEETGNVALNLGKDLTTGKDLGYRTVPATVVQNARNRWQDWERRKALIQPQITDADLGVVPQGTSNYSAHDKWLIDQARKYPGNPKSQQVLQRFGLTE